jgi:site-specific DNA-methyltransferase (adenine-specific)
MINLMQGDCLERMKEIGSGSVDAIISDIPYGIDFSAWDITHKNTNSALLGSSPAQNGKSLFKTRGKPKNGWSEDDKKRPYEFQKFCESWLHEAYRVLKPASPLIIFTGRQNQHRFTVASEDVGFCFKDSIIWDKVNAPFRAQNINNVLEGRGLPINDSEYRLGNLAPVAEPIVWSFKPYKVGTTLTDCFIENRLGCFNSDKHKTNLLRYNKSVMGKVHETQKPIELMEALVEMFTLKGHMVMDMFMGSGTTGVACKNLNRNFIGIELDEQYFKIAQDRISAA